jgi:putative DNA primase/helicase
MNLLDYANKYANDYDFSIIPINYMDKKPTIIWKEYQTRKPTNGELKEWFGNPSQPKNIAIVTGKISKLVVLDVDSEEAFRKIKEQFEIPKTLITTTGKGYHLYFCYDYQENLSNKTGIMPSVDIRAEGGYVVAPPSIHQTGRQYEFMENWQIAKLPDWLFKLAKDKPEGLPQPNNFKNLENTNVDNLPIIPEGERNDELTKYAGYFLGRNCNYEEALKKLQAINQAKCQPPLSEKEVETIVKSIYERERNKIKTELEKLENENLTEVYNAKLFASMYENQLVYCEKFKSFFSYEFGKWQEATLPSVTKKAVDVVKYFYKLASTVDEEQERKRLIRHGLKNETRRALRDIVELAKGYLEVNPNEFDKDNYKINLLNGTYDLQTQEFYQHKPEDFFTKQMNVKYNPEAKPKLWLDFLNTIFNNNQELIEYIQKALGYSLSGDVGEDCFFLLHGTGANGKTTFLNTIKTIWNDYAKKIQPETLLQRANNQPTNDIARLNKARLAIASEMPDGGRLNENKIKELTGRDTIIARMLYQEFFEFEPTAKFWIATNYKPTVKDDTNGFWRRMRLIPFEVTIKNPEENYEERLLQEKEGILNWILEGYIKWSEKGLGMPKVVEEATNGYREQEDILADFFSEKCDFSDVEAITATKELYEAYCKWSEANNIPKINIRAFGRRLESRNLKPTKFGKKRERGWQGIKLI